MLGAYQLFRTCIHQNKKSIAIDLVSRKNFVVFRIKRQIIDTIVKRSNSVVACDRNVWYSNIKAYPPNTIDSMHSLIFQEYSEKHHFYSPAMRICVDLLER